MTDYVGLAILTGMLLAFWRMMTLRIDGKQMEPFPAGIILWILGLLTTILLNPILGKSNTTVDWNPTYIGLAGFAVLGSMQILKDWKRENGKA